MHIHASCELLEAEEPNYATDVCTIWARKLQLRRHSMSEELHPDGANHSKNQVASDISPSSRFSTVQALVSRLARSYACKRLHSHLLTSEGRRKHRTLAPDTLFMVAFQ
jgi:hypothetical protein